MNGYCRSCGMPEEQCDQLIDITCRFCCAECRATAGDSHGVTA